MNLQTRRVDYVFPGWKFGVQYHAEWSTGMFTSTNAVLDELTVRYNDNFIYKMQQTWIYKIKPNSKLHHTTDNKKPSCR